MVMKPLSPCNHVGCRNITSESYCDDHAVVLVERKKERDRHYNRYKRDADTQKFYDSSTWKKTREAGLLKDNGLCQHCLEDNIIKHAEMVDHIIPIKIAWHLGLFMDNLQSLCNQCHAIKTAEDRVKFDGKA